MSKYVILMVVAALICVATAASAVTTVYVNDFGTVAQRTVGGTGDWTSQSLSWGTAQLDYYPNGWNDISVDLDGDALHGGFSANSWQGTSWIRKIDVSGMSNISITAHGFGHPGYGCSFGVGLSLDGVTWDYTNGQSAAWSAYPATTASVTATGSAYQGINTVYMYVNWSNGNFTIDQPWYTAYVTDVTVTANVVPVPEPGSMLALGSGLVGLVGFAIRRRK